MYEEFHCLPRNPFLLTPDPEYLLLTKAHGEALAGMNRVIVRREGFVVLTGEAGTGKTTLVWKVMASMAARAQFSLMLHPTLTPAEFLENLLMDFGVAEIRGGTVQRLALLQQFLLELHSEGKSAVLVVDEAHKLSVELLEEIRLMTNFEVPEAKLLQVILVGQSELDRLLDQECMQQLKQRLVRRFTLSPLSPQEVGAYLQHRWSKAGATSEHPFVEEAVNSIIRYSRGIPRVINVICDNALLLAYADRVAWVGEKYVLEAAENLQLLPSSKGAVASGPVVSAGAAGSGGHAPALLPPSDSHSMSIPIRGSDDPAQNLVARLAARTTRWFRPPERRRATRIHIPALCVYHWTGGASTPHKVANISEIGAYLETRVPWSPGTIIMLTLQQMPGEDGNSAGPHTSRHVVSQVVRSDPGGIGVHFIYTQRHERLHVRSFLAAMQTAEVRGAGAPLAL